MLVKDLIKILKKHNPNNRVVFYNLENHNLTEYDLESIIDYFSDINPKGEYVIIIAKEGYNISS